MKKYKKSAYKDGYSENGPREAYLKYLKVTVDKNPYKIDETLCDPYSTKYMPKGGNCDPLEAKEYVDNSDK